MTNKPVLGVIGDSYFAATVDNLKDEVCAGSSGKHYTEILSGMLGYDYFTLARGGCSNTAIRLQADEMIARGVDFLIYGTTTWDRMEIPHRDYDVSLGVYNIKYDHCPDLSSQNPRFVHNTVRSETILNVLDYPGEYDVGPKQFSAISDYYQYVYIDQLKKQQDAWIVASGIQAVKEANIPFLLTMAHDYEELTSLLHKSDPRYLLSKNPEHHDLIPQNYSSASAMRRWHTDDNSQRILAEKTFEYIQKHSLLQLSC